MRSLISPFVYLFRASLCIGPHFSNSLISAIAVLTLLPMPLRVLADCPPGFGAPSFFTVDGSPYHVVAGDFNNDGKLDLAAACYSVPGNISVLIGNGDGSFSTSIAYPVSGRCFRVVVGDCNNDNNLDLAVLHEYGWGILLGNGTGAFQTVTGNPAIVSPYTLALADFNEDNNLDVVMGTGSIGAAVLLGNGDGTFQAPTTAGPFSGAPQNFNLTSETLTISDFNNDGHMDIASIGIILFGNGNGAFQSPLTFFTWPGSAASIWSGDLDANGTADIVLTSGAELRVFLGNGNGTFHGPSQDPNYFAFSNSIKAVDVAGTGQLDLVIARSGAIDVFVGNGDGTFQPWVYFEIENCNRYSILAEDFDGDTRRDIVGGCFDSGRISLMSNGAPISLSQITLPSPAVISIQAGQTLALSVVLSGVTGPTFRWRRNGIPLTDGGSISGAATSDLSITPVLPQDSGIYDILLGADCRSATSRYVSSVTVNCACGQRPTFTQQPANRTVLGGGSATYSTMVNGTGPLAYQWRRSGVPLTNAGNVSGADTSTLTLSPVSIADGGFAFDCVVTDSCGSDRSDPAGLQVITTTQCHGDFNNDGSFNGNDIQFIVDALLSGQACP